MHARRYKVQSDGEGVYLAAWQDGAPVGYVLLYFKHPPHHGSFEHYPNYAYVEGLYVRPEYLRQGIALALMENVESGARSNGASHVGLSVGIGNEQARALYRKLGYQPSDIPDYQVSWTYLDPATGGPKEEGEMCGVWAKLLV